MTRAKINIRSTSDRLTWTEFWLLLLRYSFFVNYIKNIINLTTIIITVLEFEGDNPQYSSQGQDRKGLATRTRLYHWPLPLVFIRWLIRSSSVKTNTASGVTISAVVIITRSSYNNCWIRGSLDTLWALFWISRPTRRLSNNRLPLGRPTNLATARNLLKPQR